MKIEKSSIHNKIYVAIISFLLLIVSISSVLGYTVTIDDVGMTTDSSNFKIDYNDNWINVGNLTIDNNSVNGSVIGQWNTAYGWGNHFWSRAGTTLYPTTDGDNVQMNGTVTVEGALYMEDNIIYLDDGHSVYIDYDDMTAELDIQGNNKVLDFMNWYNIEFSANSYTMFRAPGISFGGVGFPDQPIDITGNTNITGDLNVTGSVNITDGHITLYGDARTSNDLWIDAGAIKSPGLKPATAIAHGILETPAWEFGNEGVAGNQESVSWSMRIPNRMDRTVAPVIVVGWSADGVSPGVCEWQLGYLWTSMDEDTSAGAQENITINGTASSTSNGLAVSSFIGIDIPSATDMCIHCKLTRLSAGTNDTIADTVELHGVCLQFTSNKLGGFIG